MPNPVNDPRIEYFLKNITMTIDGAIRLGYFLGNWDADTNTPTLSAPQTGVTTGSYYKVSVEGSTNIGEAVTHHVGDYVTYDGAKWINTPPPIGVSSINGQTGDVTLTTTDIAEGSNLYYTEARVSANTDVADATTHISRTDNPHSVTKTQVGLGNVLNLDQTDPTNITQDPTHRFVSDTEKSTWNAKQIAFFPPEFFTLAIDGTDVTVANTITDVFLILINGNPIPQTMYSVATATITFNFMLQAGDNVCVIYW